MRPFATRLVSTLSVSLLCACALAAAADARQVRDGDDAQGSLDLAGAGLDQRVRQGLLSVRTHGRMPPLHALARHPKRIDPASGRHLCAIIGGPAVGHGRALCLGGRRSGNRARLGVLRYYRNGHTRRLGGVDATLERRGRSRLSVRFPLREAGLTEGRYRWRMSSAWSGEECRAEPPGDADGVGSRRSLDPCEDRAPSRSSVSAAIVGVVRTGCSRSGDSVYTHGPRNRRQVALTFDDGPSEYTSRVLAILDRYDAKGTFFAVGRNVAGRESLLRRINEHGHELANHSLAHEQLPGRSSLARTSDLISRASGFRPCVFRPPYGLMVGATVLSARSEGMSSALWDVDTGDWQRPGSSAIRDRALRAGPGSIVLMHDGGGERSQTVAALPSIVKGLRARGYRLVTVTRLLGERYDWREER